MSKSTEILETQAKTRDLAGGSIIQHYTITPAAATGDEAKVCIYKSETFTAGSRLCQAGKVMICNDDGSWGVTRPLEKC